MLQLSTGVKLILDHGHHFSLGEANVAPKAVYVQLELVGLARVAKEKVGDRAS